MSPATELIMLHMLRYRFYLSMTIFKRDTRPPRQDCMTHGDEPPRVIAQEGLGSFRKTVTPSCHHLLSNSLWKKKKWQTSYLKKKKKKKRSCQVPHAQGYTRPTLLFSLPPQEDLYTLSTTFYTGEGAAVSVSRDISACCDIMSVIGHGCDSSVSCDMFLVTLTALLFTYLLTSLSLVCLASCVGSVPPHPDVLCVVASCDPSVSCDNYVMISASCDIRISFDFKKSLVTLVCLLSPPRVLNASFDFHVLSLKWLLCPKCVN